MDAEIYALTDEATGTMSTYIDLHQVKKSDMPVSAYSTQEQAIQERQDASDNIWYIYLEDLWDIDEGIGEDLEISGEESVAEEDLQTLSKSSFIDIEGAGEKVGTTGIHQKEHKTQFLVSQPQQWHYNDTKDLAYTVPPGWTTFRLQDAPHVQAVGTGTDTVSAEQHQWTSINQYPHSCQLDGNRNHGTAADCASPSSCQEEHGKVSPQSTQHTQSSQTADDVIHQAVRYQDVCSYGVMKAQPKRPKNGFIRFSMKLRKEVAAAHPRLDNREVSRILGNKWRKLPPEEKKVYEEEFYQEMCETKKKHPGWQYGGIKKHCEPDILEPMPNRLRPRDKLRVTLPQLTRPYHKRRPAQVAWREPMTLESCQWVQCDNCQKWRRLPPEVDLDTLPELWFCELNPGPIDSCFFEQEPEDETLIMDTTECGKSVWVDSLRPGLGPLKVNTIPEI